MPRTRTKSEPIHTGVHGYTHNGGPLLNETECILFAQESTITDTITPDWFGKIQRGEIVANPMMMSVNKFEASGSGQMDQFQISNPSNRYLTTGSGSLTYYFQHTYGGISYGDPPIVDEIGCVASVAASCIAQIDTTPYSFAEDVGEIGETLRFLKNPVASLYHHALRIKKLRVRTRKKLWKTLRKDKQALAKAYASATADIWLTERFAVEPLVRSISSAMSAYEDVVFQAKRQTARSRSGPVGDHLSRTLTYSGSGVEIDYLINWSINLDVKAGIIYEIEHPLSNFRYKYGLRNKDIPETVWNLIPLSFMVDRVYNISDAIRGITNLLDPNLSILTGWITTKRTEISSISAIAIREPGYGSTVTPDTDKTTLFYMHRTVWEPSFIDTVPVFKPGNLVNDATKIADLLALSIKLIIG